MYKLATLNEKGNPAYWFLKFEHFVWMHPAHMPTYFDDTKELLNPFLKRYGAHLGKDLDIIYFKNKAGLNTFKKEWGIEHD